VIYKMSLSNSAGCELVSKTFLGYRENEPFKKTQHPHQGGIVPAKLNAIMLAWTAKASGRF
jgi:hypothetical protein